MDDSGALTDSQLIRAALAGDKDAFGKLIARTMPLAIHAARSMLGSDEAARDLAQEAMLQAYLSLDSLRDPERFTSWLYGIVLNLCRSHIRNQRIDYLSLESLIGGMRVDSLRFASAAPGPEQIAEERDLHRRVLDGVRQLSPRNREAVLLFYFDGLALPEIAALLGTSVTAIKGRLHKSRQSLRHLLMDFEQHIRPDERIEPMIQVKVIDVVTKQETQDRVVILLDEANRRMLPIWIGPWEADSIALMLTSGYQTSVRPLTYAFMGKLLQASGMTLEEARIDRLDEDVFYGIARVRIDGNTQQIDTRPSDVIALALQLGAPIYASEAVMERVGIPIGPEYSVEALGKGAAAAATPLTKRASRAEQDEADPKPSIEEMNRSMLEYVFGAASEF